MKLRFKDRGIGMINRRDALFGAAGAAATAALAAGVAGPAVRRATDAIATAWRDIGSRLKILSVDCPVLESGLGGTMHLEDLMRIGSDGAEPIHEVPPGVIVV